MNEAMKVCARTLLVALLVGSVAGCAADEAGQIAAPAEKAHAERGDDHAQRVHVDADLAIAHGIETAPVGAGVIREALQVFGRIAADPERVRAVGARFSGMVRSVEVAVGDSVRSGATLATVESNESLRSYRLTAPIDGIVIRRAVNPGEQTGDGALFELADYSRVWAELTVFPRDRQRLHAGQAVTVDAVDAQTSGAGVVADLLPPGTQVAALRARVLLDNTDARWTPGQFVSARVSLAETPVQRVVPLTALQQLDGREVVFVAVDDAYEARVVRLGRRDGTHAEVLDGIGAGERIVVANSYLLKADIGKSGAAHDH